MRAHQLNLEHYQRQHNGSSSNNGGNSSNNNAVDYAEIFQEILEKCYHKITYYNNIRKSKMCSYNPPLVLVGKPLYKYKDLLRYLIHQLTDDGFMVELNNLEGNLYIYWDPDMLESKGASSALSPTEAPPKVSTTSELPRIQSNTRKLPPIKTVNNIVSYDDIPINLDRFLG